MVLWHLRASGLVVNSYRINTLFAVCWETSLICCCIVTRACCTCDNMSTDLWCFPVHGKQHTTIQANTVYNKKLKQIRLKCLMITSVPCSLMRTCIAKEGWRSESETEMWYWDRSKQEVCRTEPRKQLGQKAKWARWNPRQTINSLDCQATSELLCKLGSHPRDWTR